MKKQTKQNLIWGGLLITFGVVTLMGTFVDLSVWLWVFAMFAGGLGIYSIYALDRSGKWLLILSYLLITVASLISLLSLKLLRDPFVPAFVLLAIAFPFLVTFLQSGCSRWGLLIPAYILLAISIMVPLLEMGVLDGIFIAVYVFFAIAIPFFVGYAIDTKRWWALIPSGVSTMIGLSFLIAENIAKYIRQFY